jgi:hypothetical protein
MLGAAATIAAAQRGTGLSASSHTAAFGQRADGPLPEPDLERLDEQALRVLFFARVAVSEVGGTQVTCPHLLIGVLQVDPALVNAVIAEGWDAVKLRARIAALIETRDRLPQDVDLPLSGGARRALQRVMGMLQGGEMATPTHLFVSVLGEQEELEIVAGVLKEAGVRRPPAR